MDPRLKEEGKKCSYLANRKQFLALIWNQHLVAVVVMSLLILCYMVMFLKENNETNETNETINGKFQDELNIKVQ